MPIVSFAAFAVLSFGGLPAGPDLVVNGGFVQGLGGWTAYASPAPAPAWAAFDAAYDLGSGSALLTNSEAAANTRTLRLRQCLIPAQPGLYHVHAKGYIPSGQVAGRLVLSLIEHNDTTCTGGGTGSSGAYLSSIGAWAPEPYAVPITAPPGTASIEVILSIDKDPAGGSVYGYMDSVSLVPDAIFAARFE